MAENESHISYGQCINYQYFSLIYVLDLKPGEKGLDWPTRKRIAFGAAHGLEYLHEFCNPKIIHRDLKAANILLDDDFEPVLGDFGLAKLVDTKATHVTTQVRGTMGHIAPEYLSTGKSSEKTDVFGYGITLLELVTGQRAIDFARLEEEEDVLLLDHVRFIDSFMPSWIPLCLPGLLGNLSILDAALCGENVKWLPSISGSFSLVN